MALLAIRLYATPYRREIARLFDSQKARSVYCTTTNVENFSAYTSDKGVICGSVHFLASASEFPVCHGRV